MKLPNSIMNFTSNIEIHAKGVYFSFYQTTDSDTFVNSVVASIDNDTLINRMDRLSCQIQSAIKLRESSMNMIKEGILNVDDLIEGDEQDQSNNQTNLQQP